MSHFNRSIRTAATCIALALVGAACGSSGDDAAQTATPGLDAAAPTLTADTSETAATPATNPPAAEPASQAPAAAPVETQPPAPTQTQPPAPTQTQPPAPVETDPPAPVETDPPAPAGEIVDRTVTIGGGTFSVSANCFINKPTLTFQPTGTNEIFGGSNRGTEQPTNVDLLSPITISNQDRGSPIFRTSTEDDYNTETGFAFLISVKGTFGDINIQYSSRLTTEGRHASEILRQPGNDACFLTLNFFIESTPLA
jgi:outer membrane biosynthesis protein TonB